ncbi:MAG: hypothetical protein R3E13_11570 [Alphaproteobacteria bacterium]
MKRGFSTQRSKQWLCTILAAFLIFTSSSAIHTKPGFASTACTILPIAHQEGRTAITNHIAKEFNKHRDWLVETFFKAHVLPAMQLFTEQMSVVAMEQTMMIGQFFDAKHQLETQRLFQELQFQAHKDYQPSTAFCTFGTGVRSLAHSESVGRYNAQVLGQRQLARHLGRRNMGGAPSADADKRNRWTQFTHFYCDDKDNNWLASSPNTGLSTICKAKNPNRVNIDIDYTRAVENRRTLDIMRPEDLGGPDEIDTQALGNNLFGHELLFRDISAANIMDPGKPEEYMQLRSIAAKRSVAENSYNSIIGLKSLGSSGGLLDTGANVTKTFLYLGAILTELGIPEDEVDEYIGLPDEHGKSGGQQFIDFSYYNQLELLAKKIYQNPDFYANLYDKPANVKRVSTALKAIDLMLDRAIYESQLRQEMAMSVLLSSRLRMSFKDIDNNLE